MTTSGLADAAGSGSTPRNDQKSTVRVGIIQWDINELEIQDPLKD